jgi:hypothetical protein
MAETKKRLGQDKQKSSETQNISAKNEKKSAWTEKNSEKYKESIKSKLFTH